MFHNGTTFYRDISIPPMLGRLADGEWRCALCQYKAVREIDMKNHVELRHHCATCKMFHEDGQCGVEEALQQVSSQVKEENSQISKHGKR